jgi:hypothetical protein
MLWPDPNQRPRLVDIRDNLLDRIAEAEREGWLGEVEGLRVSLAGAEDRLAQIDHHLPQATSLDPRPHQNQRTDGMTARPTEELPTPEHIAGLPKFSECDAPVANEDLPEVPMPYRAG